ncbi:carbohydrate ABC transporter permease [Reinekea marinisedimentorum]|uniref:sn-glycerol-3-phosphate transport system permease protein UgpE n=1 Tax=Reinekea marinisedimentorum TaxID=230495 RepID=A0A4R3I3F7_9GAMM|nr:carbohydrate ABC transporter permease [Reinekea marinisedimentorum]TCS40354.1 multiple sugar transport system permease protein [Reinekea marinisedimentorum]
MIETNVDAMRPYKTLLRYAVMIFLAYIFAFPLLFMVMSSFKTENAMFADMYSLRAVLPVGDLMLDNYQNVFRKSNIELFFFNSVIITTLNVLLGLIVNSMAAFSMARLKWKGQEFVLIAIVSLLIVPFEAIAIPLLMLVAKLPWIAFEGGELVVQSSWLNTLHVQIIPGIANAFQIFLFYQFFRDIPKDFDEAAAIDGASPLRTFWSLIVPMSGPVFATATILAFLANWNNYLWPILTTQSESARPIMVGIQMFFSNNTDWGEIMAYSTLTTIPVFIVFIAFQKKFVASLAGTGIKG